MNNKKEKENEDKERIDQLESTIQRMTQTAIKRDQTIQSLQEELDRTKKVKPSKTQEQRTFLILGDSNAHSIHPYLNQGDDIKYEIQPAYTMKQLEERVSEMKREETRTILIHTGTNDIRHGEKASIAMTKLKAATQKLEDKGVDYVVVQVPPVYYAEDANDTRRKRVAAYNTLISDHFGDRTITTSDLENDLQYIGPDKLHLTEEGNKKSAQIIQTQINEILKHPKKDGRKETRKREERKDREP